MGNSKQKVAITAVIILIAGLNPSADAQYPTTGLSGYYPLNGNANDLSGHGFNGILDGQIVAQGICSDAFRFYDNFIDCGDPSGNEFDIINDATISLWVKLTEFSWSYYTLIGKDVGAGNYNKKWFLALYPGCLTFHINGPYSSNTNGGGFWVNSSPFSFSTDVFYHIVLTKSGNNYDFFINTVHISSGTLPENVLDVPFDLYIGKNEMSNVRAVIDEVFLYDRVLSQTEIEQLYHQTSVSITVSQNPLPSPIPVTFTANGLSAGSSPQYNWYVNGISVSSGISFNYTPMNGDLVQCKLTSSDFYLCNPAWSIIIQMSVNGIPPVVVFSPCFSLSARISSNPFQLKGGLPLGGIYSGTGVNSLLSVFSPGSAGIGNTTVTYTYTNSNSQSSSQAVIVSVVPDDPFSCGSGFTDPRDNQSYPTFTAPDGRCWMSANLNYGTQIQAEQPQADNCEPEKYCIQNIAANCTNYGGLYQWDELMNYENQPGRQDLCPPGWHVPTTIEWETLVSGFQGNALAGIYLKDQQGISGFMATPAGLCYQNNTWQATFSPNTGSMYWTSTAFPADLLKAEARGIHNLMPDVSRYQSLRNNALFVRCVKN